MSHIRIITDSASDLHAYRDELTVLPLTVTFGDESFEDGVTLTQEAFYEKLVESDVLPTTSQIPPFVFEEAMKKALDAGEVPIVITLSSKLSGTYQSAMIAKEALCGEAYVIDSRSVAVGERILIEYAFRLIDVGFSADEIVRRLEEKREQMTVIALVDTLEYLVRGGRLSRTVGFVGGMLAIKPVVAIRDGEVAVLGKARGSKNSNNLLSEMIAKSGGIDFSLPLALGYTGLSDVLLQKYIRDSAHLWQDYTDELPVSIIGGAIGTHVGPGGVAVAFFHK